jgi:NitT/TauT family transport system permease protein
VKKFFQSTLFFYTIFFLLTEWVVNSDLISSSLVPKPSQIIEIYFEQSAFFLEAFLKTASASTLAFVFASGFAFLLALALHLWPGLQKKITPLTLFLQTVPIVAIAPLLVIYLGFGFSTLFSAAMIVCFFPVFAATSVGLQRVQKNQSELFQFLKASELQKLFLLEVPSALPTILAGLKTAAGLSVVGVVSGEFVAGGGLGALIDSARLQQRTDLVFAALILLSIIGLAQMKATEFIFKLLFRRYLANT